MAKTLLNATNEILKRVAALDSDAGVLSTLTDSARQHWIDVAIQVVNEGIDELYSVSRTSKPKQLDTDTITLATSTRNYTPDTEMIQIRTEFHLYDQTNNHYIFFLGVEGYETIILGDPEEDDTGLPSHCAIRPTDGALYMNRTPTASEAGRQYLYRFDKDLELTIAADTVPFSDAVFRAMVPAWAELWKKEIHNAFDGGLFNGSIGRAARLLSQIPMRDSWLPIRIQSAPDANDPFHEL